MAGAGEKKQQSPYQFFSGLLHKDYLKRGGPQDALQHLTQGDFPGLDDNQRLLLGQLRRDFDERFHRQQGKLPGVELWQRIDTELEKIVPNHRKLIQEYLESKEKLIPRPERR